MSIFFSDKGDRLKKVRALAAENGWEEIDWQENLLMVSFVRSGVRINVYISKMTVATCLKHPKRRDSQLFRKRVDFKTMDAIFKNPRVHTDAGYYRT